MWIDETINLYRFQDFLGFFSVNLKNIIQENQKILRKCPNSQIQISHFKVQKEEIKSE